MATGYTVEVGGVSVFLNPQCLASPESYVLFRASESVTIKMARLAYQAVKETFPDAYGGTMDIHPAEGVGASAAIHGKFDFNQPVAQAILGNLEKLFEPQKGKITERE